MRAISTVTHLRWQALLGKDQSFSDTTSTGFVPGYVVAGKQNRGRAWKGPQQLKCVAKSSHYRAYECRCPNKRTFGGLCRPLSKSGTATTPHQCPMPGIRRNESPWEAWIAQFWNNLEKTLRCWDIGIGCM